MGKPRLDQVEVGILRMVAEDLLSLAVSEPEGGEGQKHYLDLAYRTEKMLNRLALGPTG